MISTAVEQSISEKIQQRRYQILVHSYLYYGLNNSIVSDHTFDRWAKELVRLQEQYPKEAREVIYHEEFATFDGASGFYLPFNDAPIEAIGDRLLKNKWVTGG